MSCLARNQNGEQVIELVQNQDGDDFSEDEAGEGGLGGDPRREAKINANTTNRKRNLKFSENDGKKTLVDSNSLDVKAYDTVSLVDPLFKQTTQKYDEMKIGNLMGASLSISSDLLLQLDS